MRKTFTILLVLFMALSFAQTAAEQNFQQTTSSFALEVARNWQLLSIIALMISIILVAIAYAVGTGFEMPEIKAWASNELVQVITNAIIIAALMAVIAFIEITTLGIVASSGINVPSCYGSGGNSTSCLQGVTSAYLDGYYAAASQSAKDVLNQNMDAAGMAGRRIGLYCLTIYCLQIGATTTIAGHYVIKSDMYGIIFQYYTNLLGFIEAQQFIVEQICFKMGPVLLAMGILGRSFFFTRKLGGLLMAMAIGLMFFLPGMYVFDWVTLNTVLNGDKGLDQGASSCPAECGLLPPMAYFGNGTPLTSTNDVYAAFPGDAISAGQIVNGTLGNKQSTNASDGGQVVYSCNTGADQCPVVCRQSTPPGFCSGIAACSLPQPSYCPIVCRELPYPTAPTCLNETLQVQQACAALPAACKIIRQVQNINTTEYGACPDACKVVPPLQSNCNVNSCLASSLDCRLTYRDPNDLGLTYRPTKSSGSDSQSQDAAAACALASQCPANLTASQSCVYVLPKSGLCDDLCGGCPQECRIDSLATTASANLPSTCKDGSGNYLAACTTCTQGCMVQMSQIQAKDAAAVANSSCGSCALDHRIAGSNVPLDYVSGGCAFDQCGTDYRVAVPRNACEMCLYSQPSYAYNPPINTQCSDQCKPSDNAPVPDPLTFSKIGQDGMVGVQEIQDLSRLMIPIYVLPLFNIVTTLVFIKGLSTILGGDIEIPGLSKVF